MDLTTIKNQLPDYARDLKLNLSSVTDPDSVNGLNPRQVYGTALASAYAVSRPDLVEAICAAAGDQLDESYTRAAKGAAALMGMNNVYYRFTHLVEDENYARLPARLRMNLIGNPGIDKADFELFSLAVSAINGCGKCITAHESVLRRAEWSRESIQDAVRIASVIAAVAVVLDNEQTTEAVAQAA